MMPDTVASMTPKARLHRRQLLHGRDLDTLHRVAARTTHALARVHRMREVEPRRGELGRRTIHVAERATGLGPGVAMLDLRCMTRQASALLRDQEIG